MPAGRRVLSRMGASLAAALGLPDLVARTPRDYVDVARHAARRPGRARRLGRLKMRLRRAVRVGTLFNADAWVYWYEVRQTARPWRMGAWRMGRLG